MSNKLSPSHPLGSQGLHIIREAANTAKSIERAALRSKVEEMSVRPTPGTSNILTENKPLAEEHHGVDRDGKPGTIKVYDLVGSAPFLWCRKGVEKRRILK